MLFSFALIFLCVSAVFSLYRQFQMLQQNSYFPSRYYGWVKDRYTVETAFSSFLFLVLSLLFSKEKYLASLFICIAVMLLRVFSAVHHGKTSIKRLVFTARIKRMLAAAIILLGLLLSLSEIFSVSSLAGAIFQMLLSALACVSPLLTLAVWCITYPLERAFTLWYINDAKRTLKNCSPIKVIGITGSYGKTTTKFILRRILSEKFNVVATPQSFNTPMGVVRTIRSSLKPQTQIFICEMGAKKTGDIKEICDIVSPDYGIISSVGAQHLDTFHSVDNVFTTKFELADAVRKNGGEIFVNMASSGIAERAEKATGCLSYGTADSAYYAENVVNSRYGASFDLVLDGEKISVVTRLLGEHAVSDIVAAAAVAHRLGVEADKIAFAISQLKPTEHRLELKPWKNGSLLIDDAYNANPEGSRAAVSVLGAFEGMRKVIITPGLIELGEKEYDYNYSLGLSAAAVCDMIILVGKNRSKPLREAVESTDFDRSRLYVVSSFAEAMEIYAPLADENSVVLLENDLPDNYLN